MNHWLAPRAHAPLQAVVQIPGSKSQTNRALILAALASGRSTIDSPLVARDTKLMCDALVRLGVEIDDTDPNCWAITPIDITKALGEQTLDAGLAGTVMRFILPVAALTDGVITIEGDQRAKKRPIHPLLQSMRSLGMTVSATDESLPIVIVGQGKVAGGRAEIDASASSQFVSALLLAGARFERGLELVDIGPSLPSRPHIEMSLQMLAEVGVDADQNSGQNGQTKWQVMPGVIQAHDWAIEPDLSNAAPFIAAAMVTGGEVEIVGWPDQTTQAGDHLRELIQAWGGSYEFKNDSSTAKNPGGSGLLARGPEQVLGVDVDLHDHGELTPVVAAVCACAVGPSTLRKIGHLRGHESDRLSALAENLRAVGVSVIESADALTITPSAPSARHPGLWRSFDDHRLATAGAVIGLVTDGVSVDDVDATAKTLPNFTKLWQAMLESTRR